MKKVHTFLPHQSLRGHIISYEYRLINPEARLLFPSYKENVINIILNGNFRVSNTIENEIVTFPEGASVIVGSQSKLNYNILIDGFVSILAIYFRPGSLHYLTGIPIDKFDNLFIAGDDEKNFAFNVLWSNLMQKKSLTERVAVLDEFFLQLLNSPNKNQYRLKLINHLNDYNFQHKIEWYAGQSNMSLRNFERVFKQYIGTSPKSYFRKMRFKKLYEHIARDKKQDWFDLCEELGYYDQAHLSKEFKFFTGYSPLNYLKSVSGFIEVTY